MKVPHIYLLLLFIISFPTVLHAQPVKVACVGNLTGDYGGLQMSPLYSDYMVLQRNKPLEIQGMADRGEKITVSISSQKKETIAGPDGKWKIILDPLQTGPTYTLNIASPTRTLQFKEVIAGEVWLCSGQSNMAFMVKESVPKEIQDQLAFAATRPNIRIYDMKPLWLTNPVEWEKSVMDSLNNLQYFKPATWKVCNETNVQDISAIAFAFARKLTEEIGVPIGLIINAVGGSPTEAWIDRKTLEFNFPDILIDWTKNDFIQPWVRERATLNIRKSVKQGQRHPYEPVYLFESGILPLQQYPLRGVLWYQGESNAHNIEAYEKLFPLLVSSWRKYWNEELPFYYVQLSSINRPSWPGFRDTQRRLMENIPGVGMAVSSDRGDSLDVHPRYKKDIGERLARWALNKTYNLPIVPSGPLVNDVFFTNEAAYVSFKYGNGLRTSDGEELRTFEISGKEGLFYPARAEIQNNRIKVWSPEVSNPCRVRYAWQPFTRANLVNGENIPASTFQFQSSNRIINKKEMKKTWTKLPDLPGMNNTASLGVSAPYVGLLNGNIVVAGGCNFPDKPVTEGGAKRYYNEIHMLTGSGDNAEWKLIGHLPYEAAYGAAVYTDSGMVCIGGNNNQTSFGDVYLLTWNSIEEKLNKTILPSLPQPMDNMAAALLDNKIYVAGGNEGGKPSVSFLCLDLKDIEQGWKRLSSFPGAARVQPVMAALETPSGSAIYLAGGFCPPADNSKPSIPNDVLIYYAETGEWNISTVLPPLPDGLPRTLTGGCSIPYNDGILFFGGVNYDCFYQAIDRPRQMKEAKNSNNSQLLDSLNEEARQYMHHPVEWYKFNTQLLYYNVLTSQWEIWAESDKLARAGAGTVIYNNRLIVVNGELKPGIRTPEVNALVLP